MERPGNEYRGFCVLSFLFGIIKCNVSPFAGTDADGICYGDNEDTAITDFSGLRCFDNGLHGFFCIFVAYYYRNKYSFYGTCVIHYATVDAPLT